MALPTYFGTNGKRMRFDEGYEIFDYNKNAMKKISAKPRLKF